jgi:hypothetical protein
MDMPNENIVIFLKENYSRKSQLVVWGIYGMEDFQAKTQYKITQQRQDMLLNPTEWNFL